MIDNGNGKNLNQYVKDYVLFDLETTGVSFVNDEVVEISAVKVADGKIIDQYSTLVNPGRHIPDSASSINGIYDAMVADAPNFKTALAGFLEFAGNAVLVGHNIARFDMKFIVRDARRFWGKSINNDYIDTLQIARKCLPGRKGYKLVELAEHYGISSEGAHRALNDCRMNQLVYEKLGAETEHTSEETLNIPKCPLCGSILKKRSSVYGEFWGCASFPNCRFTQNI